MYEYSFIHYCTSAWYPHRLYHWDVKQNFFFWWTQLRQKKQTNKHIYVGKIWYPCVRGVTVIVESCLHPLLTHITRMHITNNTYIPNTPRPQCLNVFNPALHWHGVIYPNLSIPSRPSELKERLYPHVTKLILWNRDAFFLSSCEFNLYQIWHTVAQDVRICSLLYHSNLLKKYNLILFI